MTANWKERIHRRLIGPPFSVPVIVRGAGSVVTDVDGVDYLDFSSGPGVLSLGHCDPEVVAEIRAQVGVLTQGPGKFLTLKTLEYAEALAEIMPPGLDRFFFANSGAEAVDGAVKLALKYSIKKGKLGTGIMALDNGFHGRTSLPLALTTMPDRKRGFGPYATFPGVVFAASPYCYRCPLCNTECNLACLESIRLGLELRAPGEVAVFIAELIQSTGGIIVPPDEYWPRAVKMLREYGVTIIFDEIFTGFGRTGKMFACEHWGVRPDIMTVAKAIGGGLPLGAIVAVEEVASAFDSGDHYTTFGANNVVSLAAGMTALKALVERGLIQQSIESGEYLLKQLRDLQKSSELIGDVRGKGLLIGVEIVTDRETKRTNPDVVDAVVSNLRQRRVLVLTSGYQHATIRLIPPLTVKRSEIDRMLEALDQSLKVVESTAQIRGRA